MLVDEKNRNRMIMKLLFFIFLIPLSLIFSQEAKTEIFLIDSYVENETNTFILSFFTSDSCKSKVIIDEKIELKVSDKFADSHKRNINLENYNLKKKIVPFKILVTNKNGAKTESEIYEFELSPELNEIQTDNSPGLLIMCCMGGTIFFFPSPAYIHQDGQDYFALTKEIPVFTIYGTDFEYPNAYFKLRYTYIFNHEHNHIIGTGYNHMFDVPVFEYVSPGVGVYSNFNGNNGANAEFSVGLFKITSVFTVFGKYRYNHSFSDKNETFHEISLGLYSSFFTINL